MALGFKDFFARDRALHRLGFVGQCVGAGRLASKHFCPSYPLFRRPVNSEFRQLEILESPLLLIAFLGTQPYSDSGDEFRTRACVFVYSLP